MDISQINAKETNTDLGIIVGDPTSEIAVIEFVNLRCPYCRQWFNNSKELIDQAIKEKKAYRVIKLFDKEKESLQRGNVMHQYVTKGSTEQAYQDIAKIFETQDAWGDLELSDVAKFAEEELKLENYEDLLTAEAVIDEANRANIKFVPTVIIGEQIFDESIDNQTLRNYLKL